MKFLTFVLVFALAGTVQARTALKDDPMIEDGLQIVATGKMLYRGCDAITPRRIKAFSFARSLQKRARALGYSDAEIDAYLDSEADKKRIKAKARNYLEGRGVDFKAPATFCKVGQSEIAKETAVGRFLRSR